MSRRSRTPALVVISWRDIPAQVSATGVDGEVKALLPSRFQKAIDRAARVAGKTDHHSYIAEWRRSVVPLDAPGQDAPEHAVRAAVDGLVAQLDAEHDRDTLAALVRRGGVRDPHLASGAGGHR